MEYDFSDLDSDTVNSAFAAAKIKRQYGESMRAVAQANQEKIKREEKMVAGAEAIIAQNKLLEKQLQAMQEQNELLTDNYTKLKELYDTQVNANSEAREDLKRSRKFNITMMIVSILAMLAAIAGPIATILVSE